MWALFKIYVHHATLLIDCCTHNDNVSSLILCFDWCLSFYKRFFFSTEQIYTCTEIKCASNEACLGCSREFWWVFRFYYHLKHMIIVVFFRSNIDRYLKCEPFLLIAIVNVSTSFMCNCFKQQLAIIYKMIIEIDAPFRLILWILSDDVCVYYCLLNQCILSPLQLEVFKW